MSSIARACPSCKTTLPADAVFCHKCGSSTPMEIDGATGQIQAPALSGLEEAARRARLQAAVGDTLEVRRLLGRGGFAEVYVAYDRRLKREVAVKTIRGDLVINDTLLERFQREAEAVAKLRHPHVIPIYSVGEANGLAYFTMPLIEGESLADLLEREGRLSIAEGCRILREAANALHAAHRAGLVHRDIKPENVMLEGAERTAVVMDFGIAKTEGPEARGLTGTGMLVGTPQYMSPEQATGERELDARSDQYSLAMVGYRMLTGQFPFAGDTVQQLIFKTVTEVPLPASDLSSDVSKELSAVLAKALSKAPADRYESMAAFSAALAATDRNLDSSSGTRGFRRPEPDMATRIRQGMQSLPRWRNPLVALAILGAIGSVGVNEWLQSRTGTAVATNRSDAIFAAKAFLASRGVQVTGSAYPTWEPRTHAKQELLTILGSDSTDRRAATDIPVWVWTIKFGKMDSGLWSVDVGPQNRIVAFAHLVPDSATLPTITHDSARVLADREITARGWVPAALELVTDSTVRRRHRVDHVFRWRRHADAIPGRTAADSSFLQVTATVRGDQVADYATNLRLPDSHEAEHETKFILKVVTFVGWTLAIILCGFAFGMGVTRQRIDQLQWGAVLRLLGVAAALLCLVGFPLLVRTLALAEGTADIFAPLIIFPIMIAMVGSALLFAGVIGESLAKELRPGMVRGIDDVSRGRLMTPEVMSGILWGYVLGFIAVGANALLEVAAWRGFGVASIPGKVSMLFSMSLPGSYGIVMLAGGILGAFAILFAVAFFARLRLTSRIALVLPALLTAAMFAISPDMTELSLGLAVLIFSIGMWHWGFIPVVIGFWVPDVIKDAITVMRSGSSEFMAAGIITLAIGVAPLALALVLYRRYRREA